MAEPVFDASKPYEEAAEPRFDPSKAFEEISAPQFDPQAPFETVDPRISKMADATRSAVNVIGRSIAALDIAQAGNAPDAMVMPGPETGIATDEYGRPVDPRGRPPEQANPAREGMRLTGSEGLAPLLTPLMPIREAFSQGAQISYLAGQQPPGVAREALAVAGGIVSGVEDVVGGGMEFLTSPVGLATLGLSAAPAALRSIASATFAADMASHAPEALREYQAAPDVAGKARALTKGLGTLAMTTLAGAHAYGEAAKAIGEAKPALPQVAPLTAEAVAKVQPPLQEAKPISVSATPLTTAALESVKGPSLETTAPTPAAAAGESGKPPVTAGVPPAKIDVAQSTEVAKLESEQSLTTEPELIGMGGAIRSEFESGRTTATGIKNAAVDAERQSRGQEPILAPQRIANPVVWDQAMSHIDREPGWQDRLVEELKESPRTPSAEEVVALDHRYVDLQNEYAKATRDGAQHYKDGFEQGIQEATERASFYESKLAELEQVARNVGTEWGRSGQMRQRLMNEDFSLAAMEAKMRAAKGFAPLTESEHAQVADLHRKLQEAETNAAESATANSERILLLETQKAMAEARAAAQPMYEPRVLAAAEKFASFMDKKGEDALARIKARLGRTSAGIDPTILSDVGILGAAKITRGAVEFAKWTDAMVRDLGEWFREHAQGAWDASQNIFSKESDAFEKRAPGTARVRRAAADVSGRIEDTKASIKTKASGEGSPLHSDVRKLVKLLVEQNRDITRDQLIDTVHGVLKESIPTITRLEAMDAISGRGKFWTPDQGEVAKTVRDLSTQIRLVGHQIDVEAGRPLPRTGYQPEKLTDAARREQQILNDLKRRYGVTVTDPAAQLGSALQARKTYYTNRIADLQAEIAARERIVKNKAASPTDPALEELKSEYQKVKTEHDDIFQKEISQEQRLARAISAAERAETAAEERLKRAEKGDFKKAEGTPPIENAGLTEIRARTAALREETKLLKDLANTKKTPEQKALQALKTRLAREKADLEERLAKGDFSPRRKKRDIPLDSDTAKKRADVQLLRDEFKRQLEKHQYDLKGRAEKVWLGAKEAINLSRAILTSWDVSAVFRQGGFIAFGNPARASRALRPMFSALKSDRNAAAMEAQIQDRANAPLYASSKLFLAPREGGKLTGMEEAFMSRLASKIPGVAASQRAYVTFLNKLRADTFDDLHAALVKTGGGTPEELKAISNYINVATGRGNLGKVAGAAETLSTVFFSPRLVASRFQLILGEPLYRGSAKTRYLIAKEYSKFLMGIAAVYGLAQLSGASVETDPRSSDFGKLRFGKTRVDPLGGLSQVTVLLSRLVTGEKMNLAGKVERIRGDVPYGKATAADVIANFLRTKLSPIIGSGVDIATGKNVVGEPVTGTSVAVNAVVPLSFRDILDVMEEQGIPRGTAIGVLSLFGMGVQNYEDRKKQAK